MTGSEDQRQLDLLRRLGQIRWFGSKIRDAVNEEISARTAKDEQPWDKLVNVSKYNWQRRIAKTDPHIASPEERRAFYELILRIVWLEKPIRRVIAQTLGISTEEWMQWWADAAVMRIVAHLQRMEQNHEEPRKGVAMAEIANEDGIAVDAAEKRFKRNDEDGRREDAIEQWLKDYEDRRRKKAMKEWLKPN
jgi:DNA polymerase III alpha subunit